MIRTFLMTVTAFGLATGCYNEDKFGEDYSAAYCDKFESCEQDYIDYLVSLGTDEASATSTVESAFTAACETEAEETEEEGDSECAFNADNAQTCIDEIEAMACDAIYTGAGFPTTCSEVCE